MPGHYEKVVRTAVGDQWSDDEVQRHAKAIRDRIQLGYLIPVLGIILWVVLLSPLVAYLEDGLKLAEGLIHLAVVLPILIGLMALVYGVWFGRRYPGRYLSHKLKEMGMRPAVCLSCGYSLKGSVALDCPECGATLLEPAAQGMPD